MGSPERELPQLRRNIQAATTIFLFNHQTSMLYGPFKSVGSPDFNIVPGAFVFTAHVRVTPASEEKMQQKKLEKWVKPGPKTPEQVDELLDELERGEPMDPEREKKWRKQSGTDETNKIAAAKRPLLAAEAPGAKRPKLSTEVVAKVMTSASAKPPTTGIATGLKAPVRASPRPEIVKQPGVVAKPVVAKQLVAKQPAPQAAKAVFSGSPKAAVLIKVGPAGSPKAGSPTKVVNAASPVKAVAVSPQFAVAKQIIVKAAAAKIADERMSAARAAAAKVAAAKAADVKAAAEKAAAEKAAAEKAAAEKAAVKAAAEKAAAENAAAQKAAAERAVVEFVVGEAIVLRGGEFAGKEAKIVALDDGDITVLVNNTDVAVVSAGEVDKKGGADTPSLVQSEVLDEAGVAPMEVDIESLSAELAVRQEELRKIVVTPANCRRYLQKGRLVQMQDQKAKDLGWGILLSARQEKGLWVVEVFVAPGTAVGGQQTRKFMLSSLQILSSVRIKAEELEDLDSASLLKVLTQVVNHQQFSETGLPVLDPLEMKFQDPDVGPLVAAIADLETRIASAES